MKSFSMTDIGLKRTMNQDYVFCEENEVGNLPNLFLVADGMGGHRAGDFASRFCVETIVSLAERERATEPVTIIDRCITKANKKLYDQTKNNPDLNGAGTTVVAATIYDGTMYVANVGDSRLYVLHPKKAHDLNGPCVMKQITEDHSLVEMMVKSGEIKPEEARNHPNKNVITRAIGAGVSVEIDYFEVDVAEGDLILMCSDGLTNMVEDEEIMRIIRDNGDLISRTTKELIKAANRNGGKDNIGIVLIRL